MNPFRHSLYLLGLGFVLAGCLFDNAKEKEPEGLEIIDVGAAECGDLTGAKKKTTDSLMELANAQLVGDMEYYFGGDVESWEQVRSHDPKPTYNLYEKTLKVAPNHCGAMFGRTVASIMMVSQDPDLDSFIKKLETEDNISGLAKVSSGKALIKLTPEEAPSSLVQLSQQLNRQDPATIEEAQALIENIFLPKIDTAIAYLSKVVEEDNFAFQFEVDGDVYELDISEVGPLLASFKIAKAWMLVVVGYNWDIRLDGRYDWMETIDNIRENDFKNLSAEQEEALDHLTSLFSTSSSFSRTKPAYKDKIKGIPALLVSSIGDLKRGLNYSISESNKPQTYDLFRVGTGMDYDVMPSDLEKMIALLEIGEKYITGEVLIEYNKGSDQLKVNFSKLFEIDGIQNLLPYFKFRPYEEWADYKNADTLWSNSIGNETMQDIYQKIGLEYDYRLRILNEEPGNYQIRFMDYVFTDSGFTETDTLIAEFNSVGETSCRFDFEQSMTQTEVSDQNGYVTYEYEEGSNSGDFTVSRCREGANGPEFIENIEGDFLGPFYFTDASGKKTLELYELENYEENIPGLKNKILFRDPTMGGIFPELTNANIWSVVKSLETVEPRSRVECEMLENESGFYEEECKLISAENPSDLDLIIENLYWLDNM